MKISIDELQAYLEDRYGGWATEQFERIPEEGEFFEWNGLKVTVDEMDDARILRLRVERLPQQEET